MHEDSNYKILKIKHFVIFITLMHCVSCVRSPQKKAEVHGKILPLANTIEEVDSVANFIDPYRTRINTVLDSPLAHAAVKITKATPTKNTNAGNLLADIVLEQAQPIFQSRTQKDIDFVLLNHGGIRSIISKGAVSARTAYEVMPFENTIAVAELNGKSVRDLLRYLIADERPHPIAGLKIVLDKLGHLQSASIQGTPFNEDQNYFVATSNYLISGGDKMNFFKDAITVTETDYLIRNAIIDYFKKVDTIAPVVDDRFIQLN